ncbi:hypothetical protein V2J09_013238 [Rumex salicifolius]
MASSLNPPQPKRKRRQSSDSQMIQEHLATVMTISARVLDLYEAEAGFTDKEKNSLTVDNGLSVLSRTVFIEYFIFNKIHMRMKKSVKDVKKRRHRMKLHLLYLIQMQLEATLEIALLHLYTQVSLHDSKSEWAIMD